MSHRPLKSFSDLAQNWLTWGSRYINVRNFRVFCRFFWKIRKNSDLKFENRKFWFKFPLLQRSFFWKNKNFWNFAHWYFRTNKFAEFWNIWDFFWKSWKKSDFKFEIWPNFKLDIAKFSTFSKKVSNIPKLTKFIYSEIHLSKFWARSEQLLSRDFYKGFPYKKIFHGNYK